MLRRFGAFARVELDPTAGTLLGRPSESLEHAYAVMSGPMAAAEESIYRRLKTGARAYQLSKAALEQMTASRSGQEWCVL